MVRNTAREIAVHLSYELSFTDLTAEELLDRRLTPEAFSTLADEDPLYREAPNAKQAAYIRALVRGVDEHAAELDGYISKYAKGWNFSRIPLVASAIMRVAMYEILYMPDIPNGAAINEAVEIAKKYETPETVKFINGILGSFRAAGNGISERRTERGAAADRRCPALFLSERPAVFPGAEQQRRTYGTAHLRRGRGQSVWSSSCWMRSRCFSSLLCAGRAVQL